MNVSQQPHGPVTLAPGKAYFSEKELAERHGISVKKLQKHRDQGTPYVPYRKFGRAVRYAVDDIVAFEEGARRASTSDSGRS